MRSKTSFFNFEMFRKGMARWWPLWTAYFAVWALALPVHLLSDWRGYDPNANAAYLTQSYVLNSAVYGGVLGGAVMAALAAMAVWSFLYSSRSAHGMACLPVRREGQFLSAFAAGFAPVVCANVVIFLLTLAAEASRGAVDPGAALTWLCVVTLSYLFFYCFATLCAQLTGNIIILPLVYAVLNFVVWVVYFLINAICSTFVYGMTTVGMPALFRWLSPVLGYLMDGLRVNGHVEETAAGARVASFEFEGWGVVIGYAVAGVLIAVGALLLFRARRMETAGDVVAVKPLKPVFRWCMGLGCALVFSMLMYYIVFSFRSVEKRLLFLWLLLFMLIGAFIGWFAAEMLMKKSFRVFSRKNWAGLGLCGLIIVALMLGMRFDLFGYEKRVPDAERVKEVYLSANGENALLTEPENIAAALAIHRDVIAHKAEIEDTLGRTEDRDSTHYGHSFYLTYSLKNGGYLSRVYELWDMGAGYDALSAIEALLNCPEAVRERKDPGFPINLDTIEYAHVTAVMTAEEIARAKGYDSAEDFLLSEYSGWGPDYREALTPAEQKQALTEAVLHYSYDNGELWEHYGDADLAGIDLSTVCFEYEFYLDPAEAYDLYWNACVPDIDEGTLGRVSILNDGSYGRAFYNAVIRIDERIYDEGSDSGEGFSTLGIYDIAHFSTTPTVDSARTNAWLEAHGIVLHTVAETQNK